jgi:REP-associated tyrosine transposase
MPLPHVQAEGEIYYITNVIYDRIPVFTRPSFIVPLIDSLNFYRYKQSYKLLGYVIMPDHFHILIWPQGEAAVPDIMRDFKRFTSGEFHARPKSKENYIGLINFAKVGNIQRVQDTKFGKMTTGTN